MAIKIQELAFVLRARDYLSGVLKNVDRQIEHINETVKGTARLREAAGNFAMMGAGAVGASGAIAYGLDKVIAPAMVVEDALHRIANSLPEHTDKMLALAQAQSAAEAASNRLGISQEGLLKQIYLGTSAGLSMAESTEAMKVASEAAVAANGDLETMQRTLNLAYINFKDPSKSAAQNMQNLGNIMVTAAEKFDYKDIEELRSQMELAIPTALATGTSFKDLIATLADFTRHGLTGSVAGEAFEESLHGVLAMQTKLGIQTVKNAQGGLDYARSIQQVRQHFIDLYGSMKAIPTSVLQQLQKTFGLRGIRALLIDKDEAIAMRQTLDTGLLTTAGAAAERTNEAVNQINILKQSMTNMAVDIGLAVLPGLIQITQHLVPIAHAVADFAKQHSTIVKYGVAFAAISAAVLGLVGALALSAASLLFVTSYLPALSAIPGLTAAWTGAQWLLNAALNANPIGLIIVGVAALIVAAAEVYEHWARVKEIFAGTWKVLSTLAAGFYHAGAEIVMALGRGIASAAHEVYHSVSDLAARVRSYFPFSPAKMGPLRDLNRVRIVETIAATIKPAPMLEAIHRVAQVAAIAMPMMIGAPAMSLASVPVRSGATSRAPTVVIHYSPTINGASIASGEDLKRVLDAHSHELAQIIGREMEKHNRTKF